MGSLYTVGRETKEVERGGWMESKRKTQKGCSVNVLFGSLPLGSWSSAPRVRVKTGGETVELCVFCCSSRCPASSHRPKSLSCVGLLRASTPQHPSLYKCSLDCHSCGTPLAPWVPFPPCPSGFLAPPQPPQAAVGARRSARRAKFAGVDAAARGDSLREDRPRQVR